jgi:DNA-binding NarL/FixJ family response regulator
MAKRIRVLIADDHDVVRQGLKFLIRTEPGLEIAGEADNGQAAVKMARELKPDVVLMDVVMPHLNGLQATRSISRQFPGSRVLVLSAFSDEETVQKLLDAGAAGYLTKQTAAEELLRAIYAVNEGKQVLGGMITRRVNRCSGEVTLPQRKGGFPGSLTQRETEVLRLIADGLGNKQIGEALGLSIKTVEKHRQTLMDKLGIHDIAGLTRYAVAADVVPCEAIPANPGLEGGPAA